MRTTLDIDETILAAGRARARSQGISLGRAISELALKGLQAQVSGPEEQSARGGFEVFHSPTGHVITDELVRQHRDD